MLINKPEEDDGITDQFNHLCRTHQAAATSSNASPKAPRQIIEASPLHRDQVRRGT